MSDRTKPAPGKVISGTHGYFWWNGDICYEVTSFEAKVTVNGEDITFSGDMWTDRKMMGLAGEFTVKLKKVYSRAKEYADELKAGRDPRLTLIGQLADPDNGGTETVTLTNCWLDEIPLMNFENGSIVEEEYSGGFTGYSYSSTIADPCK